MTLKQNKNSSFSCQILLISFLCQKQSVFTICGSRSLRNEKKLYQLKMLFNKLTNVFVSFRHCIDPQIVYKMLLLYILWLDERRQAMKENPGRNFQNVCFTVTMAPLGSKAASTLFHIADRQLGQNVKAYSRIIGRSHSSVQSKSILENPIRFSFHLS